MILKGIFVAKVGKCVWFIDLKNQNTIQNTSRWWQKIVLYATIDVMHAKVAMSAVLEKWKVSVWYRWVLCSSLLDGPYHKWLQVAKAFVRSSC